jgi:hypothetical protein
MIDLALPRWGITAQRCPLSFALFRTQLKADPANQLAARVLCNVHKAVLFVGLGTSHLNARSHPRAFREAEIWRVQATRIGHRHGRSAVPKRDLPRTNDVGARANPCRLPIRPSQMRGGRILDLAQRAVALPCCARSALCRAS